jgi:glyoxylase-like metal-dependent hydrolase (beta-lactamase superfamily II)
LSLLQLAPDLWRIRLPFHLELNHVNIHVLSTSLGFVLVDCGYGSREAFQVLESGLHDIGIAWRDLARIVITHIHPDHAGNAERVQEASRAPIWMHEVEADYLPRFTNMVREPERLDPWLLSWGVAPDVVAEMAAKFRYTSGTFNPASPSVRMKGGEDIGGWRVLWTPGHAPGHVCLYRAETRTLISGDHVLEGISPNIAWMPDRDMLAAFLRSLAEVENLDVTEILPSHGEPFQSLAKRCQALAAHHDLRCGNVLAAIDRGARTVQDLVVALWKNGLSPFQHRFALFEAMAHLAFLEAGGRVRCDRDGPVQFWERQTRPAAAVYRT